MLNTPLCESVILSSAYGLSVGGYKSIVEMQFADFVSSGFTAVVNLIAKSNYRWSQNSDIVVRMPCGGGVGAGPFHSQTNEVWFTNLSDKKYYSIGEVAEFLNVNTSLIRFWEKEFKQISP